MQQAHCSFWACSMLLSGFARFWLASAMITGASWLFGRAQYLHKCLFAVDSNANGKTTQRVHKNSYTTQTLKKYYHDLRYYVCTWSARHQGNFYYTIRLIHKRTIHTGTAVIWIRLVIFLLLLLFFSPSGDFEFLYKLNKYIILPSYSCCWWSLYALYCGIVEQNCACKLCIDIPFRNEGNCCSYVREPINGCNCNTLTCVLVNMRWMSNSVCADIVRIMMLMGWQWFRWQESWVVYFSFFA